MVQVFKQRQPAPRLARGGRPARQAAQIRPPGAPLAHRGHAASLLCSRPGSRREHVAGGRGRRRGARRQDDMMARERRMVIMSGGGGGGERRRRHTDGAERPSRERESPRSRACRVCGDARMSRYSETAPTLGAVRAVSDLVWAVHGPCGVWRTAERAETAAAPAEQRWRNER